MATPPTATEMDELDASLLLDLSRIQEPSNLSSIAEERTGDGKTEADKEGDGTGVEMESEKEEAGAGKLRTQTRHSSIGHTHAMERAPLRRSSSNYTSFDESSGVHWILAKNNFMA